MQPINPGTLQQPTTTTTTTMMTTTSRQLLLIAVAVFASTTEAGNVRKEERSLQAVEFLNYELDECENEPGVFGPCIPSRMPNCDKKENICYNRKPRRDAFYPDKVPKYYIAYDRVLCYPDGWSCSSCTPGRYCQSEQRCILDESYECAQWF